LKEKIKEFIGFVLWKLRWVLVLMIIVLIHIGSIFLNHKIHQAAQYNKTLHEIVMITDGMSFMTGAGGPISYKNYYKWHYVKWLRSPERTRLQKIMFWDVFWKELPDEYQYPFLGEK